MLFFLSFYFLHLPHRHRVYIYIQDSSVLRHFQHGLQIVELDFQDQSPGSLANWITLRMLFNLSKLLFHRYNRRIITPTVCIVWEEITMIMYGKCQIWHAACAQQTLAIFILLQSFCTIHTMSMNLVQKNTLYIGHKGTYAR